MNKNDRNVNVHIIHSMKGGCGKTACALLRALKYAFKTKSDSNASVLLVDADFRGSALQWLLFENPYSPKSETYYQLLNDYHGRISGGAGTRHQFALPDNFDSSKNLNQYIMGNYLTMEEILFKSFSYENPSEKTPGKAEPDLGESSDEAQSEITTPEALKELGINGYIDFIFSSSKFEDKALFRYTHNEGKYNMPAITPGIYIYRMATLIQQILDYGRPSGSDSGQYKNIIIDMPPGDDEYSDLLLRELRAAAKKNDSLKLNYYAVTTNDIGHMHLAVEKIEDIMKNNSSYPPLESVNVILNCLLPHSDFPLGNRLDPDTIENILKIEAFFSKFSDKCYILRQNYLDAYRKFCRFSEITEFECDISQVFTKVTTEGNQLKNI